MSGDTETPEQKSEALSAVYSTIFAIFTIVVIGYVDFTTLVELGFYLLVCIDIFITSS